MSWRILPRTVWFLGALSLLNDAASELVYPLVPLYLSSVLLAGPRTLGLIEGAAEATASLLKLFAGAWSDRSGTAKPWVLGGYGAAAIARPLIALVASWPALLVLRLLDRAGKGLRTAPRDAMLARAVQPGQRGLAFGFHRAMDNAGAVIGPVAGALALRAGLPIQDVLLWTLVPGLACVALAASLPEVPLEIGRRVVTDWRWQALPVTFRRYLGALALFTLANSSNMFLLLRAKALGLPAYQVPLAWGAVALVAALLSVPMSAWSDRLPRQRLIVAGWGLYGLLYLALGLLPPAPILVWIWFLLYGVFLAATEGAEKALVADLVPPAQLGSAYGWFNLIAGLLLLPASYLFGQLWEHVSPLAAFAASAGFAGAAAVRLHLVLRTPA